MSARVLTDETTAAEVFAWHQADSPECRRTGISWRSDGFGCRTCGWVVQDPLPQTLPQNSHYPPGP